MTSMLTAVFFLLLACSAAGLDSPDAATIIQRSVEANQRDWAADPHYDCREEKKTKDGSRTYEELMIEGSPYERLISINHHPLSPDLEAREKRALQETISKRKNESPADRKHRIAKYEAERHRDHVLTEQLSKAFQFTLEGEQKLDGREVYVLKAVPRPDYVPPNRDARVLTGMQGTLWIDTETYQWVKVQAHVIHPVSISGFLARVEPGTEFELEKMPVTADVWLPKHFAMKSHAKVLVLFSHQGQEDDQFSDYQPSAENGNGSALGRHVSKALPRVRH